MTGFDVDFAEQFRGLGIPKPPNLARGCKDTGAVFGNFAALELVMLKGPRSRLARFYCMQHGVIRDAANPIGGHGFLVCGTER